MNEFSSMRTQAGFDVSEIAEDFSLPLEAVARWERGDELAPIGVIQSLRALSNLGVATQRVPSSLTSTAKAAKKSPVGTLFQGDCLEILPSFDSASVDLILCDLPYGTTQNRWDSIIDLPRLWREYRRILKPRGVVVLTAQGIFTAKLILSNEAWFKYKVVWEKSKSTNFLNVKKQPLRKHEDICIFYNQNPTYNPQMGGGLPYDKGVRKDQLSGSYGDFSPSHVKSDGGRYPNDIVYFKTAESEPERQVWHPTQKPVELGKYLVRTYSNEGDVVLDNAFGSGSFLVSAALEKREFIGIERNQETHLFKGESIDYVTLAAERLQRVGVKANVHRNQ